MKITNVRSSTIIKHSRTVDIEEGPIISAGAGYHDGTFFRVERVQSSWLEDEQPRTLRLSGKRVDENGAAVLVGKDSYQHTHQLVMRVSELENDGLHEIAAMFNTEEG